MMVREKYNLNPLALKSPGRRQGEVSDRVKAMQFLESYRWSSYPDYIGKHNRRRWRVRESARFLWNITVNQRLTRLKSKRYLTPFTFPRFYRQHKCSTVLLSQILIAASVN